MRSSKGKHLKFNYLKTYLLHEEKHELILYSICTSVEVQNQIQFQFNFKSEKTEILHHI